MGSTFWHPSPSRQNSHHFADDRFKCIFMNEKWCILIRISLKFVPKGPIDNVSALVQVMAWCRAGGKPLPEPVLTQYAALGGEELIPTEHIFYHLSFEINSMMINCSQRLIKMRYKGCLSEPCFQCKVTGFGGNIVQLWRNWFLASLWMQPLVSP